MQNLSSDLLLLTTNLSQLKNRERLLRLYIESIQTIFPNYQFNFIIEEGADPESSIPICTRNKAYGYLIFEQRFKLHQEQFSLFQNATQLVAILLEHIEQDELLNNQKAHLQHLVDQQTNHLIKKQDELNEMNEEFATMNEELIETNKSLLEVNLQLQNEMIERERVEKKLHDSDKFFNHSNDMLCIAGFDGYFKILNPAWSKTLGWSTEELLSHPWIHYVHPDDIESTNNVKSTIVNGEELYLFENRYLCKDGSIKWLSWSSFPHKHENIMFGVARDVTSVKEAEKRLKQIEWMLDTKPKTISNETNEPTYGDLTQYNKEGLILNSIGKDVLTDITNDYLSLLETSSAIYEKNGDYALGIFSSGWCRFMDNASNKLCNTKSNTKALKSGKWLCHESCWTEASKLAIETGEKVDIKCNGGLNLYAEPIFASNEVVGAINFGYGNPPTNATELKQLSEKYQVDFAELSELAKAYESRPLFIIELAKKRLNHSARQIGVFIERSQAEKKLKESEEKFRSIVQSSPNCIHFYTLSDTDQLIFSGANPVANKTIGFDHKILLGKTIQEAFPNLAGTHVPGSYTKIAKGEMESIDFEIDYTDGKVHGFFQVTAYQSTKGNVVVEFSDISARRKAEEELKKSEQLTRETADLLEGLFNAIPDIIGLQDTSHNIIRYNEAGYRFLNTNQEQIKGKHCYELIGHTHQCTNCATSNAISTKKPAQIEKFVPELGIWLEARSYPILNEEGVITYIVEHLRDITNRKRTEQSLIDNEEKYRTLIEFAPDAFFQGDSEGNFITTNNKACELTGYSKEELISKNMRFLFADDELNNTPLRYDLLLKGETVTNERKLRRKDGKTIFVEMNSKMLPDGSFQSFIRDITYRVNAEEKLRILTRAIDQSPNSIVITNTNAEIEYVNPVIEKLSGYSKEELIGKNPRIFSSGKTKKEEYKVLWDTITSGKSWSGEFQNKKKNGELYWESASISPVLNNVGKITHFLAIREDVTDQKKMTKELIEAKEHAEESERLKTYFLANMSHEIRTPMNSIMGFASLLPEEESRELMVNYAQIIIQNSEQLVSLIDDIVLDSKLQTHLFAYRPKHFLAHDLLSDIHKSFDLPMYQKEVKLNYACTLCDTIQLYSDYDKLRQIITNLVSNAFKYTPKGEILLGCNQKEDCFEFYIKDTGIGIPSKDIGHVFDRFYRGSNIDQSISRGTGLGLCIVKELVEMLGGNIGVESEIGKGTTFFFTIPIHYKNTP
jgi:PAS domain S-box-containing protein